MKSNHWKYCWEKISISFTRPPPLSHCSNINCPWSKFSWSLPSLVDSISALKFKQMSHKAEFPVITTLLISSVQFSHSVVSDSLRPHESQHARPPCPSPTPGAHSESRPSSQWCHPAICFLNIYNRISYNRKMFFTIEFPSLQHILSLVFLISGFPGSSAIKNWTTMQETACSAGDAGLIPGSERSPGERNGNSL